MKIKVKNQNLYSSKLYVPVDGLISIDGEGIADVSPKCAAILVKGTNDWEYTHSEEENENEDSDNKENKEQSDRELLEKQFNDATVKELKETAEKAGFPEEEWGKMTKKLLIAYLLKKYDETSSVEEDDDEEEDDEE